MEMKWCGRVIATTIFWDEETATSIFDRQCGCDWDKIMTSQGLVSADL